MVHCSSVGVFTFLQCTVTDNMDTPSYGSPIRTYVDSHYGIRVSNDADRSDRKDFFFRSSGLGFRQMRLVFGLLMYLSR